MAGQAEAHEVREANLYALNLVERLYNSVKASYNHSSNQAFKFEAKTPATAASAGD